MGTIDAVEVYRRRHSGGEYSSRRPCAKRMPVDVGRLIARAISPITKDAFEPPRHLSVVVRIDYGNSPVVVQRFAYVKQLVEQRP